MKAFLARAWLLFLPLAAWMPLDQTHCYGQGTSYTSRSGFNAALASSTTITFEQLAPSDPNSTGTSPITVSGVSFTNAEHRLFITSPSTGLYPIPGTGQYLWNFDSGYPVGVYLPGGRTAFGADFSGGIEPNPSFDATLTATLIGGQVYTYNFSGPRGSWTFFGVTFSQPISSLVYDDGGRTHEEMLDNVSFGVAIVPEPGSSFLVLFGSITMFCVRRRSFAV